MLRLYNHISIYHRQDAGFSLSFFTPFASCASLRFNLFVV